MDYGMINELLNKYWLCETTLEEEREIRRFFASDEVPVELQAYKAWFAGVNEEIPVLDEQFDARILKQIHPKRHTLFHLGKRSYISIAASFALIVSVSLFVFEKTDWTSDPSYTDTYQDPEEALKATQVALSFVSSEIHRGQKMVYNEMKKTAPLTKMIGNFETIEGE